MFTKSRKFTTNKLTVAIVLSLVFLGFATIIPGTAGALSGSQFQSGRIVDDGIFFNNGAMTVQQIQDFLNSKVPTCDTNGTKIYSGSTTRAQYGASKGHPAPYTCLKDYTQGIPSITNGGSDLCRNSISGGDKKASQIIYDVAQACEINPQVLIVLLQKEQALVTDDWPWDTQYKKATGYGCPDSAPCNSEYYGFFNQVYNAAKAFRRYQANPNSYQYKTNRHNNIHFHPNSGCGYGDIYIHNQATAGLYIYTPYQPNPAALANLYGTGDSCSSYGNRNFWRMYVDWFGSTHGIAYAAAPYAAGSNIPTAEMVRGTKAYITFKIKNVGTNVWKRSNTFLGTAESYDRYSAFAYNWPKPNRAAQLQESTVAPGEIGTFQFWFAAPNLPGKHVEKFSVVFEGQGWAPYAGIFLGPVVKGPEYSASVFAQAAYKGSSSPVGYNTGKMAPGEKSYVVVKVKNTGSETWRNSGANATRLATSSPIARFSAFNNGSWVTPSRVANMDESTVLPGGVGTFKFWYRAPAIYGTHTERFTLVHEGLAWVNYFGFYLRTQIEPHTSSSAPHSATSSSDTQSMKKGTKAYVTFNVKNTSNYTWKKTSTRLGTAEPIGRTSSFRDNSWISGNRAAIMTQDSVAPGEIASFGFWYKAPDTTGTFDELFTPVVEGVAWFPSNGLHLRTIVTN